MALRTEKGEISDPFSKHENPARGRNTATGPSRALAAKPDAGDALLMVMFCFVALYLGVLLSTPPAAGYEISPYDAYPTLFWVFVVSAYVCGILLLISEAITKQRRLYWAAGFLVVLLTNLVILLLPVIRGYSFYGFTDQGVNAGLAKEITQTGRLALINAQWYREDVYPALHLIVATLSYVTHVPSEFLLMLVPAGFFLFYEAALLVLARDVSGSRLQYLMILAFSSPMLLGWYQAFFLPNIETALLLPLFLFLHRRYTSAHRTGAYAWALFPVLFVLPLYHPFDAIVFLYVLVALWALAAVEKRLGPWRALSARFEQSHHAELGVWMTRSVRIAVTLFVAWFVWVTQFYSFSSIIRSISEWVLRGSGLSNLDWYFFILNGVNAPIWEGARIILTMFGGTFAYLLISLVVSLWIWGRLIVNRTDAGRGLLRFSFLFLALGPLLLGLFSGLNLSFRRSFPYFALAATLVCGLGLAHVIENRTPHKGTQRMLLTATAAFLIALTVLGAFNVHLSPITKSANEQVTAMDTRGMRWLLRYQTHSLLLDNPYGRYQYSLVALLIGVSGVPNNIRWGTFQGTWSKSSYIAPDHFGYDLNHRYGELLDNDRYFWNTKLSQIWAPILTPEYEPYWTFTPEDYSRLRSDTSVRRIYDNGESQVFYVVASG
jgi:hypothetical protein